MSWLYDVWKAILGWLQSIFGAKPKDKWSNETIQEEKALTREFISSELDRIDLKARQDPENRKHPCDCRVIGPNGAWKLIKPVTQAACDTLKNGPYGFSLDVSAKPPGQV